MLQIKRSELKQLAQNKLGNDSLESQNKILVMISTSLAARISYTVVEDEKEISYEKLIEIHNKMLNQVPFHASPFEHCARVMTNEEYKGFSKTYFQRDYEKRYYEGNIKDLGWCYNYKGFISYRYIIEN